MVFILHFESTSVLQAIIMNLMIHLTFSLRFVCIEICDTDNELVHGSHLNENISVNKNIS